MLPSSHNTVQFWILMFIGVLLILFPLTTGSGGSYDAGYLIHHMLCLFFFTSVDSTVKSGDTTTAQECVFCHHGHGWYLCSASRDIHELVWPFGPARRKYPLLHKFSPMHSEYNSDYFLQQCDQLILCSQFLEVKERWALSLCSFVLWREHQLNLLLHVWQGVRNCEACLYLATSTLIKLELNPDLLSFFWSFFVFFFWKANVYQAHVQVHTQTHVSSHHR